MSSSKTLPGINKPFKPSGSLPFLQDARRELTMADVQALSGHKEKYPICFSVSSSDFLLPNCSFVFVLPANSLQEYVFH